MSKKTHSMTVLSEIVKTLICDMAVAQLADLFNDYDACKMNVPCLNSKN